jgi:Mrp family chromosome partitioning ATPase
LENPDSTQDSVALPHRPFWRRYWEKDGIPIAGLMDIDEFEDYLEQQNRAVQSAIAASSAEYKAGKSRPAVALAAELSEAKPKRASRKRKV